MRICDYGLETLRIWQNSSNPAIIRLVKKTNKKPTKTKKKSAPTKVKTQKSLSYHIGNLFLVLSFLMFFIIFYPVINTYLFPKQVIETSSLKGDYITVPKIKAQAPLILNVDPFNQSIYQGVLKNGVAHAKGTSLPGEKGRSFIFAHSSGNPLDETHYNTVFLKLGELKIGDEIIINRNKKIYKYKVTGSKIVWPNDTQYLKKSKEDGIIVQTCWPIGTSLKRLLVFAAPAN